MTMKRPSRALLLSLLWAPLLGSCSDRILPAEEAVVWTDQRVVYTDAPLGSYGPILTVPLNTGVPDGQPMAEGRLLYPPQAGRILYSHQDSQWNTSISIKGGGVDQLVVEDEYYAPVDENAALTFDGNTVAYIRRDQSGIGRLYLFALDGSEDTNAIDTDIGEAGIMVFSPNGRYLAVSMRHSNDYKEVVYIYDRLMKGFAPPLHNIIPESIPFFSLSSNWFQWTPDNTLIYSGSDYAGGYGLYVAQPGSGTSRSIVSGTFSYASPSPDGARIAFIQEDALWIINADGTGGQKLTGPASDSSEILIGTQWSPDGTKILIFRALPNAGTVVMEAVDVRTRRRKSLATTLSPGFWLK
jgi:WD40 repeat protein